MTPEALHTYVFDSTQAALWAEEVAREHGVPVEVVPAPADSDAKCDLAVVTPISHGGALDRYLSEAGVPFRLWIPEQRNH